MEEPWAITPDVEDAEEEDIFYENMKIEEEVDRVWKVEKVIGVAMNCWTGKERRKENKSEKAKDSKKYIVPSESPIYREESVISAVGKVLDDRSRYILEIM